MARRRREASAKLVRLVERVAQWRRARGGRGGRIPSELWEAAIAVARVEGVHATARAIGFNRGRLADRMGDDGSGGGSGSDARFVAFDMPRASNSVVVDVVGRHGEQMHVEGMSGGDVIALIDRLWKLA